MLEQYNPDPIGAPFITLICAVPSLVTKEVANRCPPVQGCTVTNTKPVALMRLLLNVIVSLDCAARLAVADSNDPNWALTVTALPDTVPDAIS